MNKRWYYSDNDITAIIDGVKGNQKIKKIFKLAPRFGLQCGSWWPNIELDIKGYKLLNGQEAEE